MIRPGRKWSVEDGRAPKRALSAYMIYVREKKYYMMSEFPSMPFGQMMQKVAE